MQVLMGGHTSIVDGPPIDPNEIFMDEDTFKNLERVFPLTYTHNKAQLHKEIPGIGWVVLTSHVTPYLAGRKATRDKTNLIPQGGPPTPVIPDWFRYYQREGVELALNKIRGTIEIPTSGGKTNMIGAIAHTLIQQTNVLISVPTQNLLYQMQEELEEYFAKLNESIDIGLIGAGHFRPKQLTIGIPDTFESRKESPEVISYCRSIGCWIADECHTLVNYTGGTLSSLLTKSRYRFGFSATPSPSLEVREILDGIHGPIIYQVRPQQLMEGGYILTPLIKVYPAPHEKAMANLFKMGKGAFKGKTAQQALNGEYSNFIYGRLYDYLIMRNEERNALICKLIEEHISKGLGPVLTIVNKVDAKINHVELLNEILDRDYGFTLPVIKGSLKPKEVKELIEQLRDRQIPGAIAGPNILKEGTNIHSLGGLVYACGGKSALDLIQRVGRILRTQEGKGRPIIYDFMDGFRWFHSHSTQRVEIYKQVYGEQNIEFIND